MFANHIDRRERVTLLPSTQAQVGLAVSCHQRVGIPSFAMRRAAVAFPNFRLAEG
jgi:hypothetical protein